MKAQTKKFAMVITDNVAKCLFDLAKKNGDVVIVEVEQLTKGQVCFSRLYEQCYANIDSCHALPKAK